MVAEAAKAHRLAPISWEVAGYETPESSPRMLPGRLELVSSRREHHQEFSPRALGHTLTARPLGVVADIGQFRFCLSIGARLATASVATHHVANFVVAGEGNFIATLLQRINARVLLFPQSDPSLIKQLNQQRSIASETKQVLDSQQRSINRPPHAGEGTGEGAQVGESHN